MPNPQPPKHSPIGPIAGAIVVILILAVGGLYFWGAKLNQDMTQDTPFIPGDQNLPASGADSDSTGGLPPQGTSDEVSSIEADFNAMNMNQLDAQTSADLNNMEGQ